MTTAAPAPDLAELLEPSRLRALAQTTYETLRETFWTLDAGLQAGGLVLVLAAAWFLGRPMSRAVARLLGGRINAKIADRVAQSLIPLLMLVGAAAVQAAAAAAEQDLAVARIGVALAGAWLVIRLASQLIDDPFWSRAAAILAWSGALLYIFGLLRPTAQVLDSVGFTIADDTRISLLIILRASVIVVLLFAAASWLAGALRKRVELLPRLEPSLRVLFARTIQVALMAAAGLLALSVIGVDLAALAIFGGAVGLGIGFGLQQIFANLVAGVILLLDRSIKPGDVIEIDETYGWVNSLGLRYASVVTRDGHEHLIPNELLMTQKVINWSYSDKAVRVSCPIGISYASDVRKAMDLVIEAAKAAPRTLASPSPKCLLIGFGDNSVDLEARFWIADPANGVRAAMSDVLLNVWDAFKENGVEIPFPQRDVHLKTGGPVRVRIEEPDPGEG